MSGGPDFVAEIAASTAHYDLTNKLDVYRKHAVREYLVWRVNDREIDWFVLRNGSYEKLVPDEDGILRSTILPGLWLDPAALVRDDSDTLLNVLQRGLDSPEHAAFKAQLQNARQDSAS